MTPEQQKAIAMANARMRMAIKSPEKAPKTSFLSAFGKGGADISSFGLDDELRGFGRALGTAIRSGDITPKNPMGLVKSGVSEVRSEHAQAKSDRPGAYLSGQIAGAIAPAFTAPGSALTNWLGTGGLGARAAKGAMVGGVSSGLYGLGENDGPILDRAKNSIDDAVVGSVVGGAVPVIGAGLSKLNKKYNVPTSEEVRASASDLFKVADETGGVLKPEVADEFLDKVLEIRPQTEAGRVFKGKSQVTNILDDIPSLKGKPLTLQGAKEVDEALGDLAYSTMDKFGKLTSDGKKFLDMQTTLRRTIEDADESMVSGGKLGFDALKEARSKWSTSLRLRDIEKIISNADGANQPATVIKNGFKNLLKNGDRLKGYTPEEIKAIRQASRTGIVTDLFRLMGSGLVPIGSSISGTVVGGPVGGIAAGATGYGIQQGSKAIGVARQTARAKDAARIVAERSGMVTQEPLIQIPQGLSALIPKQEQSALVKFSEKFK